MSSCQIDQMRSCEVRMFIRLIWGTALIKKAALADNHGRLGIMLINYIEHILLSHYLV